jgi:hypothetical protein
VSWNYLQVEISDHVLHPVVGPGGMSRDESHAIIRRLLERFIEDAPFADGLVEAWDEGAQDDTVYAGPYLWAIYESVDSVRGAREWVDDLARTLRASGSKVRIAW